jgi:hypothetical protein
MYLLQFSSDFGPFLSAPARSEGISPQFARFLSVSLSVQVKDAVRMDYATYLPTGFGFSQGFVG